MAFLFLAATPWVGATVKPLFAELKRRNVFRVAVLYLVCAWLIAQVADVVVGLGELPPTIGRVVLIVLALGFPVTVVLSWVFEWTPQGIRLESEAAEQGTERSAGRHLDYIIIALLSVALVYFIATHDWRRAPQIASASVAVLPFENRSAQADDLYFTDGIHEDILTQLGKISSLVVISRSSVMQFRDSGMSIPEIASELGVATVLEGGIQRSGERVRINLQLIDAASDRHLWAETYDRELSVENVFAIQSEIAASIADALHARLLPEERQSIEGVPTRSLEAYDAYLLGRRQLASRDAADLQKGREHFNRSIELDADFALAYTGLADSQLLLWTYGYVDSEPADLLTAAEAAAHRALELDPELGEAHISLGMVLQYKGAPAESYALYLRRGVELTPGSADAHKAYAVYLSESERHKEALQHLLRAAQLDPLSPIVRVNLAGALQTLGRFDEALAQTQRALDIDPRFLPALFQILQRSSAEEVLVLTSIAYKADANNPSAVLHFVLTYLRLGDDARAEQWVVELDRIAPASWQTSVARLNLSLYRSNQVEAVEYASRLLGYEGGGIGIAIPSRTLLLDDLRRGEPGAALKRYEQVYPGLLTDDPEVTGNYSAAIDLAMLLEVLGEPQKAERLLDRSLAYLSTLPDRRLKEFGIFKARIHAMRDQQEEAFAAMRQAIDAGWTFQWWFHLKQDPAFDSLRDNARFRSLVNEMDAEMARQLEEVRRLEASGEITLPPGT